MNVLTLYSSYHEQKFVPKFDVITFMYLAGLLKILFKKYRLELSGLCSLL